MLAKTRAHFFSDFPAWLAQLTDTRDQDAITYSRQFLTWMVLMGFLLKLGSRRRIAFELDTPQGSSPCACSSTPSMPMAR